MFAKYEELRKIVAVIGVEELSKEDRALYARARQLQNFLTQPFFSAEAYSFKKGQFVAIPDTLIGCQKIMSGELDAVPEDKFYMIGKIEEAQSNGAQTG